MSQVDFPTRPSVPLMCRPDDSSFGDIFQSSEHSHKAGAETLEGTVVSVTSDASSLDKIGAKWTAILPPDPQEDPRRRQVSSASAP